MVAPVYISRAKLQWPRLRKRQEPGRVGIPLPWSASLASRQCPLSSRQWRCAIMRTRNLGNSGLQVSALGLGCMGMSEFYGTSDEGASLATLERALELGVTFWD